MKAPVPSGRSAFRARALALAILLGLSFSMLDCRRPEPHHPSSSSQILILGLDGASWRFIDPMFKRGSSPT